MAIPNVTPYSGQKPVPGQDQPTFNQNMSDELDYFNALPAELNAAIDAMNQTATDVDNAKTAAEAAASEAATSATAASASGNYQGDFQSGVTSATAGESYSFGGSTWLCLANTTTDPSVGNANWRKVVSLDDVKSAEERAIGTGASIYRGSNGVYVQHGDTVPAGTTHLSVLIYGKVEDVAFHFSEVLSNLTVDSIDTDNFEIILDGTSYYIFTKNQKEELARHEINFETFGVVNDGITDNSAMLMKLRYFMLLEPSVTWKVYGNGGVIGYTDNMWLIDVKNMEFDGKGCELKNINTSAVSSNQSRPLFIQRIFEGDIFNDVFDVHDGITISDAAAGDGSVFASNPTDALKITEGEWALIYGYDQQSFSGYLPNARFFDWVLVDSVNDTTGEITFRGGNRLRNSYSNLWADGSAGGVSIGRPRIISTVRTVAQGYSADRTFPVNRIFKDTKFSTDNSLGINWGLSSVFLKTFNITQKTGGTFYTALGSKVCEYDEIRFNQPAQKALTDFAIEQDKLTELCVIKNTLPGHGLAGGTGVDNLVLENMTFPKDCRVRVGAKNVTFNQSSLLGCRAVSQPEYMLQYSDAAVESLSFNDCKLVMNDDQLGIVRKASASNTIPSTDWTAVGSRKISLTGDATTNTYSSRLAKGSLIVIGDSLTDGSYDAGVVEDIQASGSNMIVTLRGTKTLTFDDTQDLTFYNSAPPVFNKGCTLTKRNGTIVNQPLSASLPNFIYGGSDVVTLKYSTLQMVNFTYGLLPFPCYIKEIRANVIKAYTGADLTFYVEFARVEHTSQIVRVDLLTTGYRRFNSFESINLVGADVKTANLFQTPNLQGIRAFVRSDGGGIVPSDALDSGICPIYQIEIDLVPIVI